MKKKVKVKPPKKSDKEERRFRVCPKCGSTEIYSINKAGPWRIPSAEGSMYTCKNCGLNSPIFPHLTLEEIKQVKKEKGELLEGANAKVAQELEIPSWAKIASVLVVLIFIVATYVLILTAG